MGKSQLALSLMANVSKKYGPTLFCSAEMGKDALARRIISSDADIKQTDPMGFAEETAKVFREWAGVPMFFDYRARSFNNVCASIRFAHRKFGIKAAAVDYLQLLEMDGGRTEEEEIGRASKGFKNLAEDLGIPIVLLVQVNRRCEERTDKRPVMSDIRGSGRVEQDADAVVFVYREAYYNESFARPSQVELLVRANRHGPSGTGIAFWRPGGGWFRDPTPWETLGTK
jgi:replicative DNA helicase